MGLLLLSSLNEIDMLKTHLEATKRDESPEATEHNAQVDNYWVSLSYPSQAPYVGEYQVVQVVPDEEERAKARARLEEIASAGSPILRYYSERALGIEEKKIGLGLITTIAKHPIATIITGLAALSTVSWVVYRLSDYISH